MKFWRAMRLPVLLCFVALSGTLAAEAPPATAPDLEPTTDAKAAAYTKHATCKKTVVVGTRISKTVCQTAAERDAERAASQKYLQNVQDSATIQAKSMH